MEEKPRFCGKLREINYPEQSEDLAELIGIILGDGNIHRFQKGKKIAVYCVRICGHKEDDYDYITNHVANLFRRLFDLEPRFSTHKTSKAIYIKAYGKNLIKFFEDMGLLSGDKIKNQITIPPWIFNNKDYLKACLRGLIDTDGSIYRLTPHWPNLFQISFKNHNETLLEDARKAFLLLGFKVSKINQRRFYITRQSEIEKFYKGIGFSNPKHTKRYSPMV